MPQQFTYDYEACVYLSWRVLELLYNLWVWQMKLSLLSDFCFVCAIHMVEKFIARGYEEVAFIAAGLVEVYFFRA